MGMFDTVYSEFSFPGVSLEELKDMDFQTKDLECLMDTYRIDQHGYLFKIRGIYDTDKYEKPELQDYTGEVRMYWSNSGTSGPGGYYTRNGEDYHSLEYRITFIHGRLSEVELLEDKRQPAAPVSLMYALDEDNRLSDEDRRTMDERRSESLTGKTMWCWWGSLNPDHVGYEVQVVAEDHKCWVVHSNDHGFEIIHRGSRDVTFFDSYADGLAYKHDREERWKKGEQAYADYINSRTVPAGHPGKEDQ